MPTERDLFEWHAANALQQSVFPHHTVNKVRETLKNLRDGDTYSPAYPRIAGMWDGWLVAKMRHTKFTCAVDDFLQEVQRVTPAGALKKLKKGLSDEPE